MNGSYCLRIRMGHAIDRESVTFRFNPGLPIADTALRQFEVEVARIAAEESIPWANRVRELESQRDGLLGPARRLLPLLASLEAWRRGDPVPMTDDDRAIVREIEALALAVARIDAATCRAATSQADTGEARR